MFLIPEFTVLYLSLIIFPLVAFDFESEYAGSVVYDSSPGADGGYLALMPFTNVVGVVCLFFDKLELIPNSEFLGWWTFKILT